MCETLTSVTILRPTRRVTWYVITRHRIKRNSRQCRVDLSYKNQWKIRRNALLLLYTCYIRSVVLLLPAGITEYARTYIRNIKYLWSSDPHRRSLSHNNELCELDSRSARSIPLGTSGGRMSGVTSRSVISSRRERTDNFHGRGKGMEAPRSAGKHCNNKSRNAVGTRSSFV